MLSIKKQSLVDLVYEKLREAIIQLQIPLGSKLNVNELQSKMGVSCTPLREAINRLQQEGLVVYETNVGAHVISLDPHDVLEIQQLAMTLHGAAIRLAMVNGSRGVIVPELRQLDRHMLAIQGQQTLLRYIYASCLHERAADVEVFHEMLLDTINGDAKAVCDTLQRFTDRMTRVVEAAVTEL